MSGVGQWPDPLFVKTFSIEMQYLTLDEIKKQVVLDEDFHDDDEFLTMIGDSAEELTSQLLDCSLDQLAAENGDLPAGLRHALRMLVDWEYSVQRGSSDNAPDIPSAIMMMIKLYRNYH